MWLRFLSLSEAAEYNNLPPALNTAVKEETVPINTADNPTYFIKSFSCEIKAKPQVIFKNKINHTAIKFLLESISLISPIA